MNAELVFVYGTLRRGGSHSFRMSGAEWLGEGEISGKIFRIDWYPALILGKEGRVKGDLYAVGAEQLRALDLFEGTTSHPEEAAEYQRVKTLVRLASGDEISAWVWEWISELGNAPELPDGDWLKSEPKPS